MINVSVDVSALLSLLDLRNVLRREAAVAGQHLSSMAHAHAVELAGQRLHSRRKLFVDHLTVAQVGDGVWFLQLDAKAAWIEDGLPSGFDMLPGMLKSPKAKTSKAGDRYLVIPMGLGPGKGMSAPTSSQPMIGAVRAEMKKQGIPWGKIERGSDGKALLGKLHSFSVDAPLKTGQGPGQGWGPVGSVRQGPNERQKVGGGPGGGGRPFLQGVTVSQHETPQGGVRRSISTFRVASSKHAGTGMWKHPGTEPAHILLDTLDWLQTVWESEVAPALLDRVVAAL